MNHFEYLKTLPSYVVGSIRQTLATLDRPVDFMLSEMRPVVLLPGAFCTPSVMNRLGREIEARGRSVLLAPNMPYYYSAAANLCRLGEAAERFGAWLDGLEAKGITELDVAAHSNGGLIALLAHVFRPAPAVRIGRIVTMATPFGGFPLARPLSLFLPCCRDLQDGSDALRLAAKAEDLVARCLVSEKDSLIPPGRQSLGEERRTLMEGFQHMDFIVGSPDQVARTAGEVVRWLRG